MANLCRSCRLVVHRSASASFLSNYVKRVNFSTNSATVSSGESATTEKNEDGPPLKTTEDWMRLKTDRQERKLLIDHLTQFGSTQSRETTWQPFHSLHRPKTSHELTISALIAAQAHMGHSTSLLNPNFLPYSYGSRANITIIDLERTLPLLRRAIQLTRAIAARGGSVVFVGTKPAFRPAVKKAAERMGDQGYYVGEKWLPGTLTNRLHMFGPETVTKTKVLPDLVVILNPLQNLPAIRECAIEHIPTVGVIDSNIDPRIVMYPIPANDESRRTAELVVGLLSIAGREGAEMHREQVRREEEREAKMKQRIQRAKEAGMVDF